MKAADGDRIAVSSGSAAAADRSVARRRFERAVRLSPAHPYDADEHPPGHQPPDRSGPQGSLKARGPAGAADALATQADAMAALKRSLGEGDPVALPASVGSLLREIINAARAGGSAPLRGDWTLILRVPESMLARTEVEVSSRHGTLVVLVKTSSVAAYRTIVAALPQLDAALRAMNQRCESVRCRLVNRLEIP